MGKRGKMRTLEVLAVVHLINLMILERRGGEVTQMAKNGFSFSEWELLSTGLRGGLNEITSTCRIDNYSPLYLAGK